jgi:hypothetical protein
MIGPESALVELNETKLREQHQALDTMAKDCAFMPDRLERSCRHYAWPIFAQQFLQYYPMNHYPQPRYTRLTAHCENAKWILGFLRLRP